jgi:hypothetical protein
MEWHGVIVRLSAKHAEQIRKGFRSAFNADDITAAFFNSFLGHTEVTNQQARDWARVHITPNKAALTASLTPIYADGWVLGKTAAGVMINQGLTKAITPVSNVGVVDWNTWTPGNSAAAALISPAGGLQSLLDARGLTINGIINTSLDRIGTVLGNGLADGTTPREVSRQINDVINDPQRSLTIAQTEMSRAVVQSELSQYADSGIEMVEWLVADPCEDCQVNLDASPISIDESWPNGDAPVHPNCMCDIGPYISDTSTIAAPTDGGSSTDGGDSVDIAPTDGGDSTGFANAINFASQAAALIPEAAPIAAPAEFTLATPEQAFSHFLDMRAITKNSLGNDLPNLLESQTNAAKELIAKNDVYISGNHSVYIERGLKEITSEQIANVFKSFNEARDTLPEWRKFNASGIERPYTLYVTPERMGGTTNAYTYLGSDKIWLNPRMARESTKTPVSNGNWSMPARDKTSPLTYTLSHELGHTMDSIQNAYRGSISKSTPKEARLLLSRYGKTATAEAYAEVYAEWALGDRTNPLVEYYASKYGWNLSAKEYAAQTTGRGILPVWKV